MNGREGLIGYRPSGVPGWAFGAAGLLGAPGTAFALRLALVTAVPFLEPVEVVRRDTLARVQPFHRAIRSSLAPPPMPRRLR